MHLKGSKQDIKMAPKAKKQTPAKTKTTKAPPKPKASSTKAASTKPKVAPPAKPKAPTKPKVQKEEPPKEATQKPRVPFSLESYEARLNEVLSKLDSEIEKLKESGDKGTRFLKHVRKEVNWAQHNAVRLTKQKKKRESDNQNNQFDREVEITPELRKFLKNPSGPITYRDVTNALCAYVHNNPKKPSGEKWGSVMNPGCKRNLQQKGNGMVINPDKPLSKLLRYDEYVKRVKNGELECTKTIKDENGNKRSVRAVQDDPSLRYCIMNKLVNEHHILATKKTEEPTTQVEEDDLDDLELEE